MSQREALTEDQVVELRCRVDAGKSKAALARDFGVSRETVYQYVRQPSAAVADPAI